jgi:prefoldin subunit 5
MPPETKLNSKGETLYRTPGGNAWTTKDPNRVTAVIKPIAGENAGKTVAILGNSTKQVVQPGQTVSAKGITTSDNAANRAKNANKTLNDITTPTATVENPLTEMYKRLSELQKQLATAKEKEANAEVKGKLESTASAEEVGQGASADMSAGVDAIAGRGTTEGIEDPTIKALADKTTANLAIITNQMQTLDQYRQQFNEYTQQDIDSIARTAERSIKSQIEANQRTTDAMRFAGVLGGRAQFAPVTEQSIIKDVIQEGLDKIEV